MAAEGKAVRHLTVAEVLRLHDLLLDRFGGRKGVRDAGSLAAALYRPGSGHYGDPAEMAAALLESLLLHRPFRDGNRRTAFFATDVFLRLNGWRFRVIPELAAAFLGGALAAGAADHARLAREVRRAMVRREEPGGAAL